MVKNKWYIVLESKEVGKKPVGVKRMAENMVFWRDENKQIHCFVDKCCHRGAALSKGEILGSNLQCPFHGLQFDTTGKCVLIPANGKASQVDGRYKVKSYPAHETAGFIWIYYSDNPVNPGIPSYFNDIDDSFSYTTFKDPWPVHYSRSVENQLDVSHLPFVHRTTIGRGNRTLVDGPVVQWVDDTRFLVYVFNHTDNNTIPRKPGEIKDVNKNSFHLEFVFPNIWQNYIASSFRITAAFVPVDETNSMVYVRANYKFKLPPGIRWIFNKLINSSNHVVLNQDKRVVITQQPVASALRMNEQLFQADLPILEYRRKREELLCEGNA